jgi:hypothetical protein
MGTRYLKHTFYSALALGVLFGLATSASAQEICDDATHPITACSTVDCSLLVPPGATCTLSGVQVSGNIIVEAGATLTTQNDFSCSTTPQPSVGGNVIATDAKCVSLTASSVGGNFIATGTSANCSNGANLLCTARVNGNVEILGSSSGVLWCIPSLGGCGCGASPAPLTVGGNFEFENNHPSSTLPGMIMGDTIHGNLLFENNSEGGTVSGDKIGGNVTYYGNSGGGTVQNDAIGGNLTYDSNTGGANDVSTNSVGGNLQFNRNMTGPNTVSGNHASGNIQCFGNSPAPTGSGNTAGGVKSGQCKGL